MSIQVFGMPVSRGVAIGRVVLELVALHRGGHRLHPRRAVPLAQQAQQPSGLVAAPHQRLPAVGVDQRRRDGQAGCAGIAK